CACLTTCGTGHRFLWPAYMGHRLPKGRPWLTNVNENLQSPFVGPAFWPAAGLPAGATIVRTFHRVLTFFKGVPVIGSPIMMRDEKPRADLCDRLQPVDPTQVGR